MIGQRPARTVTGRTDRVVVVGAGLGGLSCALRLAGAGRQVTLLEREAEPGGRAGRLAVDGYTFDTGPTVLTMPELIDDALAAVGEQLKDWLTLVPLDPAYRAYFPDGSQLDVISDTERMTSHIAAVCGPAEADGYRRFVAYTRDLWRWERDDFIDRNFDAPRDLLTLNLLRLIGRGAFGSLQGRIDKFFADPRTRRVFSFQAMYAGLAPHRARALYSVIAYLDSVAGVSYPLGGMHAVPRAMAAAASAHGVDIRYGTTVCAVEVHHGRATAVHTSDGQRIPADVVVLNPDTEAALALLPASLAAPRRPVRLRYSPSCVVLHVGSTQGYQQIAHHNIHFGAAWRRTFDEVIRQGRLMSDPSLLVTNPSRDDQSVSPPGKHTYYVLAPVPNLRSRALPWSAGLGERYADQLVAELERRGYAQFDAAAEIRRVVTPQDWESAGLGAGTPFAAAHTVFQTGPFRPGNLHPALSNVVFVGSGTQPGVGVPMVLISGKLAAERITG
jgi:phytoene desaturase